MSKKISVLIDSKVVIDPTRAVFGWGYISPEERAKTLERWAVDIRDFFRDHRSMDVNNVSVEHEREERCSSCGYRWETMIDEDTGKLCCASCGEEVEQETPTEARAAK